MLDWIIRRCEGTVDAVESPVGYLPKPEDINLEGLDFSIEQLKDLLEIDRETWLEEVKGIGEFYAKFGERFPKELTKQLKELKRG